jgi:hypothetical protein
MSSRHSAGKSERSPAELCSVAGEGVWGERGSRCINSDLPAIGIVLPVRGDAKRFVLADPAIQVKSGLHMGVAKAT